MKCAFNFSDLFFYMKAIHVAEKHAYVTVLKKKTN